MGYSTKFVVEMDLFEGELKYFEVGKDPSTGKKLTKKLVYYDN